MEAKADRHCTFVYYIKVVRFTVKRLMQFVYIFKYFYENLQLLSVVKAGSTYST